MGFVAVLCVAGCGSSATARHDGSRVVIVPRFGTMSQLRGDRVSAVIDVGGAPDAPDLQARATDAIWVANTAKETIQRIDPKTNRVTDASATIKQPCAGLVAAFASVWSEDCGQNELVRVDERSGSPWHHHADRCSDRPCDRNDEDAEGSAVPHNR